MLLKYIISHNNIRQLYGYIEKLRLQRTENICPNISVVCLIKQNSFVTSSFVDNVEI